MEKASRKASGLAARVARLEDQLPRTHPATLPPLRKGTGGVAAPTRGGRNDQLSWTRPATLRATRPGSTGGVTGSVNDQLYSPPGTPPPASRSGGMGGVAEPEGGAGERTSGCARGSPRRWPVRKGVPGRDRNGPPSARSSTPSTRPAGGGGRLDGNGPGRDAGAREMGDTPNAPAVNGVVSGPQPSGFRPSSRRGPRARSWYGVLTLVLLLLALAVSQELHDYDAGSRLGAVGMVSTSSAGGKAL